jgi:hypothetical protein
MRDKFAGRTSLRDGFAGDCFGEIVDIEEDTPAGAAHRPACYADRKQPWRDQSLWVPGMTLQMHSGQSILHDIFGLIDGLSGSRQATGHYP